jgi:hypothetical protein
MGQTIADSTLNLSGQALAVLAMLSQREPDFATYDKQYQHYNYEATTSAWYNGRERGVSLVVRRSIVDKKCIVLTFGEVRNSDSIFIDSWEHDGVFMNPPTIDDFPDKAYAERQYVDYGRVDLAVDLILHKIAAFFESLPAIPAPAEPQAKLPARTLEIGDDS